MKRENVIVWVVIIYMVALPLLIRVVIVDNIRNELVPEIKRDIEKTVGSVFASYNIIVR